MTAGALVLQNTKRSLTEPRHHLRKGETTKRSHVTLHLCPFLQRQTANLGQEQKSGHICSACVGTKTEASYLPLNVSELGEHERPVEGQLCHVVVVDPWSQDLKTWWGRRGRAHGLEDRQFLAGQEVTQVAQQQGRRGHFSGTFKPGEHGASERLAAARPAAARLAAARLAAARLAAAGKTMHGPIKSFNLAP